MEDSNKKERKIENEKRRKKGETEKRKTLGKTSIMIYFSKVKWRQKKRGVQILNAKQV